MKRTAIIAMLTDFGLRDPYVGVMKGVILSINPHAQVIDITHEVEPQNIEQAGYLLWSSYRYFPKQTLFLCVVDPGVGSKRKIVYVESGDYRFLAPDNGLMKYVLGETPAKRVIDISNAAYFLPSISSTFHGRDILSPVAAELSKGQSPREFGKDARILPAVGAFVLMSRSKHRVVGKILHIDRFGNCITNVKLDSMLKNVTMRAGGRVISYRGKAYSEAPEGKPFWIVGSSGLMEISVKNSSAAAKLKLRLLDRIDVQVK